VSSRPQHWVSAVAALAALDAGSPVLRHADAARGVRREMKKEGRTLCNLVKKEIAAETV
jgi:hypothetical protein